jgi:hypothetical protein
MKINLPGSINSITELEKQCNALEKKHFVKLTALQAVLDVGGEKKTEAKLEDFDGDVAELGKADITEGGSDSAMIKDKKVSVSISRN